jgi:hypothetical protein
MHYKASLVVEYSPLLPSPKETGQGEMAIIGILFIEKLLFQNEIFSQKDAITNLTLKRTNLQIFHNNKFLFTSSVAANFQLLYPGQPFFTGPKLQGSFVQAIHRLLPFAILSRLEVQENPLPWCISIMSTLAGTTITK